MHTRDKAIIHQISHPQNHARSVPENTEEEDSQRTQIWHRIQEGKREKYRHPRRRLKKKQPEAHRHGELWLRKRGKEPYGKDRGENKK